MKDDSSPLATQPSGEKQAMGEREDDDTTLGLRERN